jgi:hypothetical protein
MKERKAPPRDTSKFAVKALRGVALGSSALCGFAVALSTYPDAIADGNPLNLILPLGASAVLAIGLGTAWHYTLGIASHAEETNKKALAACLGVTLCLIGCATSAWFLAAKIGGATALQSNRLEHVRRLKDSANIAALNGGSEQGLVAAFEAGGSALHESAQREGGPGHITGLRGQGSVYQSLMILAGSMTDMTATLREAAKRRDDLLARAERTIAEAVKAATAGNDGTLFQQAAATAARAIADADNIHLRDIATNFSGGVVVAAKARPVVDDVINRMNQALARADDNRRPVSVPVYVPVTAKEAVIVNPPPLAWIAAGVIEFLPLIGLALLLLLWRERHDDDSGAVSAPLFPPMPRGRPALRPAE